MTKMTISNTQKS